MISIIKLVLLVYLNENKVGVLISMFLLFALSFAFGFSTAELDNVDINFNENFSDILK